MDREKERERERERQTKGIFPNSSRKGETGPIPSKVRSPLFILPHMLVPARRHKRQAAAQVLSIKIRLESHSPTDAQKAQRLSEFLLQGDSVEYKTV